MKAIVLFKKYVIWDTILSGFALTSFKDYKRNTIIQAHPVVAIGTIRQLRKWGYVE